jgi:glycine cleavage system H protein
MGTKLYSASDEWILIETDQVSIGITKYAADQLGDIVFIDLPSIGQMIEKDGAFGAVESVKAAADLYAPISGEVISVNQALLDAPELLNEDPEHTFIVTLKIDQLDIDGLMDESTYLNSKN